MKIIRIKNNNLLLIYSAFLSFLSIMILSVKGDYCSTETCRRCCQVTPSGCINAMDFNIRVG